MNFVFPQYRAARARGLVDVEAADWRALLVMTDSSVLDDVDAEYLDDVADLDEFDGAGYARHAIASPALTVDAALNQVRLDGVDLDFGALAAGARPIKGVLLCVWGGSDSTSRPALWIDQTSVPGPYFPYTPVGATVRLMFAAAGFEIL